MGILDDAIREHLELKRQHGAGSDDLDRLENEAFGPATRPGDPDFEAADGGVGDGGEAATTVHPSPAQPVPPPLEEPLPPESLPPSLGEPLPLEPAPEPPEPPESSIFDGDEIDFGDLDLDLEEDDDGTVGPQPSAAEPNRFVTDDDDLSLAFEDEVPPTGETPLPPRQDVLRDSVGEEDTGSTPLPVMPPREEEPELDSGDPPIPAEGGAEGPAPPVEGEPGSEDLLEGDSDFLRDTPEGDRAWFEQDPPKDFDFDD